MKIENEGKYTDENFENYDLSDLALERCQFVKCNFYKAKFKETKMHSCVFTDCDFTQAQLNASASKNCAFTNCNFTKANLFSSKFDNCKMTGSNFKETSLDGLSIIEGDWSYISLRYGNLKKFNFRKVTLKGADLYGCNLEKRILVTLT